MSQLAEQLRRFLGAHGGLLPLKPCIVGRGYRGGGRLAGKGPGVIRRRDGRYKVERWLFSSARAGWGRSDRTEGFSELAGFRPRTRLRDAVAAWPESMLGSVRAEAHHGEFLVLTKILDPLEPIGFQYHQTDQQVQADPKAFPGERFGKDEAYYFLPGPKGPCPYTHVGIQPGTSREGLVAAMLAGPEALLEISRYLLQQAGMGFFVPSGLVHRPGTALTLEVQQPSDVGSGFGVRSEGLDSQGRRQARATVAEQLRHVDLATCMLPDLIERYTMRPEVVETGQAGLRAWWIMPARITRKFAAKRMMAAASCTCREPDCFGMLVWSGQARINGREVQAGQEFFVPQCTAAEGLRIEPGPEGVEFFSVFAGAC